MLFRKFAAILLVRIVVSRRLVTKYAEPDCSQSSDPCFQCDENSDMCLQHRSWWSRYTCAQAAKWCTDVEWRDDVLSCCPATCVASGADMFFAPCTRTTKLPEHRFGFSWEEAKVVAPFANVAYCGPVPALANWTINAAKNSGIEVQGSVRLVSSSWFNRSDRNFALVARLPGLRDADPSIEGSPLSSDENNECRASVEVAHRQARDIHEDMGEAAYGHMLEIAGVPYQNASLDDFQRFFYCNSAVTDVKCGTPPVSCTTPPCGSCPVNARPLTGGGCMVAVRGSNNKANFILDAEETHVRWDFEGNFAGKCEDCTIQHGFHAAWTTLREDVLAALHDLGCGPGLQTNTIHVTGHSLGAAVATVAAADFANNGFDVKSAFLFESPRTGNSAFKRVFDEAFSERKVFRIVNQQDPVPDLPQALFGYAHVGREVFIESAEPLVFHVCTDDYECEYYKPFIRANTGDHCGVPIVPSGDMCFCEDWVQ